MQFNLKNLMESHSKLQWEKKLLILNDVCLGLQYLHSRDPPIVHRDLTPNNILLCSRQRAKISDLGLAKVMNATDTKTLTQAPGNCCFMPPESSHNKPVYGLPLDMFSFGGVVLYVCTQQWPQLAPLIAFNPKTGRRIVLTELQRRRKYLGEMLGVYADLKSFVISCLDDNPKKRPLVAEAVMYIKQVKDTYNKKMYSTISISTTGEQPVMQLHDQQEQHSQQQEQDQRYKSEQQQSQVS